jgi:hypothetical protein
VKPKARRLLNLAIVVVLALFCGGVLALGIFKEQLGEALFNATLV